MVAPPHRHSSATALLLLLLLALTNGCCCTTVAHAASVNKLVSGIGDHFIVKEYNGDVFSFGWNAFGQLGTGDFEDKNKPTRMLNSQDTVHACAGSRQSCVVQGTERKLSCTGDGNLLAQNAPQDVPNSPNLLPVLSATAVGIKPAVGVDEVFCGYASTFYTEVGTGHMRAFGENWVGELGVWAGTTQTTHAVPVLGDVYLKRVIMVAPGFKHSCFLLNDGRVACSGSNEDSALGLPGLASTAVPKLMPFSIRFISVAVGTQHTCAVTTEGTLWCWGRNVMRQFGHVDEQLVFPEPRPAGVMVSFVVKSVWADSYSSLFLLGNNGDVRALGLDTYGEFATGSVATKPRYEAVYFDRQRTKISTICGGQSATCVLTINNEVKCVGSNKFGQLGRNSAEVKSLTLQSVAPTI